MTLPPALAAHLAHLLVHTQHAAWMHLRRDGQIEDLGGDLARYGLGRVEHGQEGTVAVPALEGLLTGHEPRLHLPLVQMGGGTHADLHLISEPDAFWVLLLDASKRAYRLGLIQQARNESRLGPNRMALRSVAELLGSNQALVLERLESSRFRARGPLPPWAAAAGTLVEPGDPQETFPFLEAFLPDAEAHWGGSPKGYLRSMPWEQAVGRECLQLTAIALRVPSGPDVLLVGLAGDLHEERRQLLQRAREHELGRVALSRLVQDRSYLLASMRAHLHPDARRLLHGLSDEGVDAEARIERAKTQAGALLQVLDGLLLGTRG